YFLLSLSPAPSCTVLYTLSLHDALPILLVPAEFTLAQLHDVVQTAMGWEHCHLHQFYIGKLRFGVPDPNERFLGGSHTLNDKKTDRKSTRLNSSHVAISYAVFCLKKKKQ